MVPPLQHVLVCCCGPAGCSWPRGCLQPLPVTMPLAVSCWLGCDACCQLEDVTYQGVECDMVPLWCAFRTVLQCTPVSCLKWPLRRHGGQRSAACCRCMLSVCAGLSGNESPGNCTMHTSLISVAWCDGSRAATMSLLCHSEPGGQCCCWAWVQHRCWYLAAT